MCAYDIKQIISQNSIGQLLSLINTGIFIILGVRPIWETTNTSSKAVFATVSIF